MGIHYGSVSSNAELEQILRLQTTNLWFNISDETKKKEGFVTVQHTFEILERMNAVCPHIIAKDGDKVVGYVLCMHPQFGDAIAVLRPMFKKIRAAINDDTPYMAMGQVCVDEAYRKKGIFRNLYKTMAEAIRPEYECIITEVDAKNDRSLQAHYAIGFKDLKTYNSDGQKWHLILLGT